MLYNMLKKRGLIITVPYGEVSCVLLTDRKNNDFLQIVSHWFVHLSIHLLEF